MTYCVGMSLAKGLVLMSDTRTNSGIDNISTFRKMFYWSVPGERVIAIMTAGNLATTQAVISELEERSKAPVDRHNSLLEAPTMFQVAMKVGRLLRETIQGSQSDNGLAGEGRFTASLILAGQIRGMEPRLFMIYPEGNFIEASRDTPYFQIGETKYGRPILVRAYNPAMSFEAAMKLLLVSFDSTVKANLSVGAPFDFHLYRSDSLHMGHHGRVNATDPYFQEISTGWGVALKEALDSLSDFELPEN